MHSDSPGDLLAHNLEIVRLRIADACLRAGRDSGSVTVVAVTKTLPADIARKAYALGLNHIGENRVQETADKFGHSLSEPDRFAPCLHLIGHLQSNKVRAAARLFHTVDSLDSLELGHRLSGSVDTMRVLVEVNTSGEPQKHGIHPDNTVSLIAALLRECPNLTVAGLMTVGPLTGDVTAIRNSFRRLRELRDAVRSQLSPPDWSVLSMGMSGDFELAIAEGATEVRLGSILFGPRRVPPC